MSFNILLGAGAKLIGALGTLGTSVDKKDDASHYWDKSHQDVNAILTDVVQTSYHHRDAGDKSAKTINSHQRHSNVVQSFGARCK